MDDITKDARRVLLVLYREYLTRRKNKMARQSAVCFGDSNQIKSAYFESDSEGDITDFCWELHRAGYIACSPGDDLANEVTLKPSALILMEQRFPAGIKQVVDALASLIGIAGSFI